MKIRTEASADNAHVYDVVKEAFDSAEHSDGSEHELVTRLRGSVAFIPELSLVAEQDGKIVGHLLFTKAEVGGKTVLALAPLSVLPACQRCGVGKALIAEGHKRAAALGYQYSVVLGSSSYYPKAGYVPASRYGIEAPFEVPDENFMAMPLVENAGPCAGVLAYAKEFFE